MMVAIGLCAACKHDLLSPAHCYGTGDQPSPEGVYGGFHCTCQCRSLTRPDQDIDTGDGYWDTDPDTLADWRYEVNNGDTLLGYHEWATRHEALLRADEENNESVLLRSALERLLHSHYHSNPEEPEAARAEARRVLDRTS